jgi:hypothetical protein
MAIIHIIELPKSTIRHPIGAFQERKQVMKDRRIKRAKDAKRSWKRDEEY